MGIEYVIGLAVSVVILVYLVYALLWPEKDTSSARRLLNLAVHVLRAALGEGVIASTGDALLFSP